MEELTDIYGGFHDCIISEIRLDYNKNIIEIYVDDVNANFNYFENPNYLEEPGILRFKGVKRYKLEVEDMINDIAGSDIFHIGVMKRFELQLGSGSEKILIFYEEFEMIPIGKEQFEFNPYEAE